MGSKEEKEEEKDKVKDKLYSMLEEFFIKYFLWLTLIFLIINKFLLLSTDKWGFSKFDVYFTTTLSTTLKEQDGTLITIAAVFIGIYFTVFTLLSSMKIESTFSILTKNNFNKLVKYIRNAFIGSFLYLLFSVFSPIVINDWIYTVIALTMLLYMLLSALRFGMIIYLIFNRDVKKYYDHLEIEKLEKRKMQNLMKRMEQFLDQYEKEKGKEYSREFSEKLAKKIEKEKDQ